MPNIRKLMDIKPYHIDKKKILLEDTLMAKMLFALFRDGWNSLPQQGWVKLSKGLMRPFNIKNIPMH